MVEMDTSVAVAAHNVFHVNPQRASPEPIKIPHSR